MTLKAAKLLTELREAGWTIAVHNDYRLQGTFHTFYLFTHASGVWAKGEGVDDETALMECSLQATGRLKLVSG